MQLPKTSGYFSQQPSEGQTITVQDLKNTSDLTRNGVLLRLVFFALLLTAAIKPIWWSPGGDALSYVSVAKSLAQTGTFRRLDETRLYHPPGVSIWFAPAFWFGDRPFLLISMMQWIAAVIVMVSSYIWFRRWLNRDRSILLTGLILFNTCTWIYYLRFLSEMWFCSLLFSLAVLYQRLFDAFDQKRFGRGWIWFLYSLPLLPWLIVTRPVGVFLAGGFGIAMLIKCVGWRSGTAWKHGMAIAILLNGVALISAYSWVHYDEQQALQTQGNSYLHQLVEPGQTLTDTIMDNVHRRVNATGRLLIPGFFRTYSDVGDWFNPLMLLYVLLSGLVVWGFIRLIQIRADALIWMTPLYVGMYLIWPYGQGTRFFIPLLPVIYLAGYQMIRNKAWCDRLLLILLVLHMGVTVVFYMTHWQKEREVNAQWPMMDDLATQIQALGYEQKWAAIGLNLDQINMLSFVVGQEIFRWNSHKNFMPVYLILAPEVPRPQQYQTYQMISQRHGYTFWHQ